MSYNTHAFPDYESLTPTVTDADPEYVQEVADILKDIFGENQRIHRPEHDAPGYAKRSAVTAAYALAEGTENQTLGEMDALLPEFLQGTAAERGVEDLEVTPRVLAVAAYAETVTSLDWGVDELDDEWDDQALVLVHDSLGDLSTVGDNGGDA